MGALKVKVGGIWVPVIDTSEVAEGGNEVIIAPDQPTNPLTELWMDTNAVGEGDGWTELDARYATQADVDAAIAAALEDAITDEWVQWTPTLVNASRASSDCWYYRTPGGLVHAEVYVVVNSVSGNTTVSLPVAPLSYTWGTAALEDVGSLTYPGNCLTYPGGSALYIYGITAANHGRSIISATFPFTWAAGDSIRASVTYRAAAI